MTSVAATPRPLPSRVPVIVHCSSGVQTSESLCHRLAVRSSLTKSQALRGEHVGSGAGARVFVAFVAETLPCNTA